MSTYLDMLKALKRTRGSDGVALKGLWESDFIKLEYIDNKEKWRCWCPMREIARTGIFEFRPIAMGGHWKSIGSAPTRAYGCLLADRLRSGMHVYKGAYRDEVGKVPGYVLEWNEVAEEIANHPLNK